MGSVFDIIGPVMTGPSSSHTAGAVRLGLAGRAIVGSRPTKARLGLHGSFAQTYRGHGTDLALVAGLMGFKPDDERIPRAMELAAADGLAIEIALIDLGPDAHPNTVRMILTGADGRETAVIGSSIGAGRINLTRIDQFEVQFSGEYHALILSYLDQPGVAAKATSLLAADLVNIATMRISREARHSRAMMILELDQAVSPEAMSLIRRIQGVDLALSVPPVALG
ncbi:MAG TPA: L-serine ammonia-lyase, iron-sulfur-dependent subunit beta [Bacillota bacterium]|jgi:L-serine dehydratase